MLKQTDVEHVKYLHVLTSPCIPCKMVSEGDLGLMTKFKLICNYRIWGSYVVKQVKVLKCIVFLSKKKYIFIIITPWSLISQFQTDIGRTLSLVSILYIYKYIYKFVFRQPLKKIYFHISMSDSEIFFTNSALWAELV